MKGKDYQEESDASLLVFLSLSIAEREKSCFKNKEHIFHGVKCFW